MKILYVHTYYRQRGGEDVVFRNEMEMMSSVCEVHSIAFHNRMGFLGALQFLFSICNPLAAFRIRSKAKECGADIVHFHNWHYAIGPFALLLLKWSGIKTVLTVHNYRLLCPSSTLFYDHANHPENASKKFAWSAVFHRAYRGSLLQTFWMAAIIWTHRMLGTWKSVGGYVFLTPFMKDLHAPFLGAYPQNRIFVKPNFAPASEIKVAPRANEFVFIGRLTEEKGIPQLLSAWKDIPHLLHIYGTGPLSELVRQNEKQNSFIRYHGQKDRNTLLTALNQCSMLIFPSVWYEPFGMVIIEAFSCGTPVMAFNVGGIASIVRDGANGSVLSIEDPMAIVNGVRKWMDMDEEKKQRFTEQALQDHRTLYSVETNRSLLQSVYEELS